MNGVIPIEEHILNSIRLAASENQQSACEKPKAQISCAVTAQLISAFVFATRIIQCLFYLISEVQASDCTDRFVPDLVGSPDCLFSHAKAHLHVHVTDDGLSQTVIIIIAVAAAVVLIAIIAIVVVCRRKKKVRGTMYH